MDLEVGVVVRNEQSDDEDTTNVEEQDSDVDSLDGSGEVPSRVLGLTSGDGDDFSTNVGEGGLG